MNEGIIIDGSFVEVPRQRNSREENKLIKEGKGDELWNAEEGDTEDDKKHKANKKIGTGGTCVRVHGGEHARDAQPGGRFSPKCRPDNLHVSGLQHVEI